MPEKKYSASTTDMPRPPRTRPTRARARSTSAYDIPQRSIRLPAKTKVGMASRTQLCEPATRLEGSFCSEKFAGQQPGEAGDAQREDDGQREDRQHQEREADRRDEHRSVTLRADRAALPGIHERCHTVDDDQRTAHHRREIEPAQVEIERGRERLAVQLADLPAEHAPAAHQSRSAARSGRASPPGGRPPAGDRSGPARRSACRGGCRWRRR